MLGDGDSYSPELQIFKAFLLRIYMHQSWLQQICPQRQYKSGFFMKMARNLPNPDCCETHCVTRNLWECLVNQAFLCQYALPFGSKLFCKHPEKSTYAQGQNTFWTCHAGFLTPPLLDTPSHILHELSCFAPTRRFCWVLVVASIFSRVVVVSCGSLLLCDIYPGRREAGLSGFSSGKRWTSSRKR